MKTAKRAALLLGLFLAMLLPASSRGQETAGPEDSRAAAMKRIRAYHERLKLAPRDSFLNYAIATLARREGIKLEREDIEFPLAPVVTDDPARRVDLFRLTSGAMALHESLQLSELLAPKRRGFKEMVPLSEIEPPDLETLDFRRLLEEKGGPRVEPFDRNEARLVPMDWLYLRFAHGADFAAFLREAGFWVEHVRVFYGGAVFDGSVLRGLAARLGLPDPITFAKLYEALPGPITVTLSDPFLKEGVDLTVILPRGIPPSLLKDQESGDVTRYTAEAAERLVLSTCEKALARVRGLADADPLAAAEGSLAAAPEFEYMRSLLPGGRDESVFVYLSDAFLLRLVSPRLRILESRRVRCASHLRTLVNACLLFCLEKGREAAGLDELVAQGYLEKEGTLLECPHGGSYQVTDGFLPACSVHGRLGRLTPHLDLDLEEVLEEEASAYRRFARSYTMLWQRFFDPVGVSMRREGASWEIDMEVIPMARGSSYQNLGTLADGRPLEGGAGLVAPSTVWLLSARLNRSYLEKLAGWVERWKLLPGDDTQRRLLRGFENQVTLGLLDDRMLFGFNISGFIGEAVQWRMEKDGLLAPLIGAANLPAYLAVPLKDREEAMSFLESLQSGIRVKGSLPQGGLYALKVDAYSLPGGKVHAVTLEMFTFKFRIFYALLDDFLVMATRPDVLKHVMEEGVRDEVPIPFNVQLALFPEHWQKIRADMVIAYEEAARKSCLTALSEARSFTAWGREKTARALGSWPRCPDGGAYLQEGGQGLRCTLHGVPERAYQLTAPPEASPSAKLLEGLEALSFHLRFTDQGLHSTIRVRKR